MHAARHVAEPRACAQVDAYKYIVQADGNCAALRLPELLASDSAVFIISSNEQEWYYPLLMPFRCGPELAPLAGLPSSIRGLACSSASLWRQECDADALPCARSAACAPLPQALCAGGDQHLAQPGR